MVPLIGAYASRWIGTMKQIAVAGCETGDTASSKTPGIVCEETVPLCCVTADERTGKGGGAERRGFIVQSPGGCAREVRYNPGQCERTHRGAIGASNEIRAPADR